MHFNHIGSDQPSIDRIVRKKTDGSVPSASGQISPYLAGLDNWEAVTHVVR